MSDSEEEDADNIDFSVISNSIEIGGAMVDQIMNGIHYGSAEVRNLLRNECDFIMECKVCRNLFRSFPNFVAHKRVYCKETHASSLFNPLSTLSSQLTNEETVVVQPASPTPSTGSKKNHKQKPKPIVEELKNNSFNGKSSAFKVYSKASEKVEAEKLKTKVSKVVLTPISTNPNAMFVSVSSDSMPSAEKSSAEKSESNSEGSSISKGVSSETRKKLNPITGESMLRRILERRDEPKAVDKGIKVTDKTPDKASVAGSKSPRKGKEDVKSSVPISKSPIKGEGNTKSVSKSPVKRIEDTKSEKSKEQALLPNVLLRPVQSNLGSEYRSNLSKLSKQGVVHISRLQCLICGSVFASKKSLSNHMGYIHSEKVLIYPCLLCSKKYNRFFGVTRHLQKFHGKTHQEIIKLTPKLKESAYENKQLSAANLSVKAAKGKIIQKNIKGRDASDREGRVHSQTNKFKTNERSQRLKRKVVVSPYAKSPSANSSVALFKCQGCGKAFLKKATCSEHVRICKAVNFPALSAKFSEHKRPKNKLQRLSSANKNESDEQQSSDSEEESMCISGEEENSNSAEKINSPVKTSHEKSKEDKETSPTNERVIQTRRSAASQYMRTRFLDKRRAIVKQNAIKTSRSASASNASKKEASPSKSGTPERKKSPKKSNSSDRQERNASADRNLFNLFNKVSKETGGLSQNEDRGRTRVRQMREAQREGSLSSDVKSSRDTSIDSRSGTQKRSSSRDSERKSSKYSPTKATPMETRSRLSSYDSITDKKSDLSRSSTPLSESKIEKATSKKALNSSSSSESKSPVKSTDQDRQVTPLDNDTSLSSSIQHKEQGLGSESEMSDYDGSSRVIVTSVKDAKAKKVISRGKRSKHIFALQGKISADESDIENGNSDEEETGSSEKEEEEKGDDDTKCETTDQVQQFQESRSRRKQKMVVRELDEVDGSSFDEKSTRSKAGDRKSAGRKLEDEEKTKSAKLAAAGKEKSASEARRSRNFEDTGKVSLENIIHTPRERKMKSRDSDDSDTNKTTKNKNSNIAGQSSNSNVYAKTGANKAKNFGSEQSKLSTSNSKDTIIQKSFQSSSRAVKLVPYQSTLQTSVMNDVSQDSIMARSTRVRHRSFESYSVPLGNMEQVSVAENRMSSSFTSHHMKSVQNKNLEELFNKKLMDASIKPTRAQIANERQNLLANRSVKDVTQNKNVLCIEEIWVDKKIGEPLEKVKTNTILVHNGDNVAQPQTIIVEKPSKPTTKKMYVIDLESSGETKPKCLDTKHIESLVDSNSLKCKHCSTTFASYGNLRRHVVRHLGWKRYKCKLCKFTSYNRSECSTHLLRAHAEKCVISSVSSYIIDLNKEASKARNQKKQQTLQKNLMSGEEDDDQGKRKINLRRGVQQKNDGTNRSGFSPSKRPNKKIPPESDVKSDDNTLSNSSLRNSAQKNTVDNRKRKRSLDDEGEKQERKARFDAGRAESPRKRSSSYDDAFSSKPLSKSEIHDLCDELTSASDTENDQNYSTSPSQKLEPNVATMASVLEWAKKVKFTKKGRSNVRRLSSPLKKEDKPGIDNVMSKSSDATSSMPVELHAGSEEDKKGPVSLNCDTATKSQPQTKSDDANASANNTVEDREVKEEICDEGS